MTLYTTKTTDAVFCWEIWGHGIYMYIAMTVTNSLNTDADLSTLPYLAVALPYSSSLLRQNNVPHNITKLACAIAGPCRPTVLFFCGQGEEGGT